MKELKMKYNDYETNYKIVDNGGTN